MTVRIINADVMDGLAQLDDESVHCAVTSPPYFGLRDYGMPGQIGLEPTPDAYVAKLVEVFREVRRVLRKDGTCWLNLGDSYNSAASWGRGAESSGLAGGKPRGWRNGSGRADGVVDGRGQRNRDGIGVAGLKPKDLIGIPWRVAFALQADGWWLRQDVIWSKSNPMPESIKDRCTKAHEYLFLLAKSERYHFDSEAIKEESVTDDPRRPYGSPGANALDPRGKQGEGRLRAPANRASGNKTHKGVTEYERSDSEEHRTKAGLLKIADVAYPTRNKRSVWEVATAPFPDAHFATFPPALIEPCIKAGCPEGGLVLDPFGGSGTTGLVADRFKRNAILIELNPEYAAMAERRVKGDCPMFAQVSA